MKRIMIIGGSGAGKSTFARRVGAALDLPVHHLDALHFLPGWIERDVQERNAMFAEVVAGDRWVTDGNYSGTWGFRVPEAELIIRLQIPLWRRVFRIIRRSWTLKGQTRADLAQGCPEKFGWSTVEFLWFVIFVAGGDPMRIHRLAAPLGIPVLEFSSNKDAELWLDGVIGRIDLDNAN